jgi:hypothetical protein
MDKRFVRGLVLGRAAKCLRVMVTRKLHREQSTATTDVALPRQKSIEGLQCLATFGKYKAIAEPQARPHKT